MANPVAPPCRILPIIKMGKLEANMAISVPKQKLAKAVKRMVLSFQLWAKVAPKVIVMATANKYPVVIHCSVPNPKPKTLLRCGKVTFILVSDKMPAKQTKAVARSEKKSFFSYKTSYNLFYFTDKTLLKTRKRNISDCLDILKTY